jgi:hypothetical protein
MRFERFVEITQHTWHAYLKHIAHAGARGLLDSGGGSVLYPTHLICTNIGSYFVAELIGASRTYEGLLLKRHKEKSIDRYLNQFNTDASISAITLDAAYQSIRNLLIAHSTDLDEIRKRFPFVDRHESRLMRMDGSGAVIGFGEDFHSARIDNCLLVNTYVGAVRVKHVLHMTILTQGVSDDEYAGWRQESFRDVMVRGIHTVAHEKEEAHALAAQFASIFLFQGLRETTIGDFLRGHPEILRRALGTRKFIYEPYLPWIEGPPENSDVAINPDLLIERNDGYYDIYDLKTALLDKVSITKDERRRRRFIDCVNGGVAQLSHYAEYFTYPANQQLARDKYGIEVKDPSLILVVGNFDNANPSEVQEACRPLSGSRTTVIDYDTLLQLFVTRLTVGAT